MINKLYTILFFTLIFIGSLYGQEINPSRDSDFSILGYDECRNRLKIKLYVYGTLGYDDFIERGNLVYKDSSGNWQSFFSIREHYDESYGATRHHQIRNRSFYYGNRTGAYIERTYTEENNGNLKYFLDIRLTLPQDVVVQDGNAMVEIRLRDLKWRDTRCCGITYLNDIDEHTLREGNAISNFDGVSNLTASNSLYGKIRLEWNEYDNEGLFSNCATPPINVEIFREGNKIATISGNDTSYEDNEPYHGDTREYTVRYVYHYTGNISRIHSRGSTVTGSVGRLATAPTDVRASDDECGNIAIRLIKSDDEEQILRFFVRDAAYQPDDVYTTIKYVSSNSLEEDGSDLIYRITRSDFVNAANQTSRLDANHFIDRDYEFRIASRHTTGDVFSYLSRYHSAEEKYSNTSTGVAVSNPVAVDSVSSQVINNGIRLTWQDNSDNEDRYIIRRINTQDLSEIDDFEVPANSESYDDMQVRTCTPYSYVVVSENVCTEVNSEAILATYPAYLNSFFVDSSLVTSKGYYKDRVRLEWENDGYRDLIDNIHIYRRRLGSTESETLIATIDPGSEFYEDMSGESSVLYTYILEGRKNCGGTINLTNILEDIGFRVSSGTVTGNISFAGGNAVENVRVVVEPSDDAQNVSRCLQLDGVSSYGIIPNESVLPDDSFTVEFWAFSTNWTQNAHLYRSPSQELRITTSGEVIFSVNKEGSSIQTINPLVSLNAGWHHFTTVFDGTNITLYVDGNQVASRGICSNCSLEQNADYGNSFYLGAENDSANHFSGRMDEFRAWNTVKDAETVRIDYSRRVLTDSDHLIAYWNFDESVGSFAYDISKISENLFNENHLSLSSDTLWSSHVPPSEDLASVALTDDEGNYRVDNIYYSGVGQIFQITPILGIHSFSPSSRTLFIGDNSAIHNSIDFQDESSFRVSGLVMYEGTTCPAEGLFVTIDGEIIISDGSPVVTSPTGSFSLDVPIGLHNIGIRKNGHTFSVGQWPTDGSNHDFQDDISGIRFIDNTKRIVIGRVVGGDVEANKTLGFGYSNNNIGQSTLTFMSTNSCYAQAVLTDINTGEYKVELPPLVYTVDRSIASNPGIDFGDLRQLDLESNYPIQYFYADSADTETEDDSLRVAYQIVHEYVYYSPLSVRVTNSEYEDINLTTSIGESTYTYANNEGSETEVDLSGFLYPFFFQDQFYAMTIGVYESYTNRDNPNFSLSEVVTVTGATLSITNNISNNTSTSVIGLESAYDTVYTFRAGNPNFLANNVVPNYSYTKTIEIIAQKESRIVSWTPLPALQGGDSYYRGYILGAVAQGSAFSTQGPEIVEHILRDPPGSNSYTQLAVGSVESVNHSWNLGGSFGLNLNKRIKLGTEFSAGLGVETPTNVSNTLKLGFSLKTSISGNGNYVESKSLTQNWQTSSSNDYVGADADLFIGNSRNFDYGETRFFELLPDEVCSTVEGITCFGDSTNGFRLGTRSGLFLVPDGYATSFIYTQRNIEDQVIPDLERLRNQLFFSSSSYRSNVRSNHENYGTNNDDPAWGPAASTSNYPESDVSDRTGSSYIFTPSTEDNTYDSVRYFNQQIRLWKEALAINEKAKLEVRGEIGSLDDHLIQNISLGDGTSYSNSSTSSSSATENFNFDLNFEEEIKLAIGAEVGGSGVEVEQSIKFTQNTGYGYGSTSGNSTTFTYHLEDTDEANNLSVDVFESKTAGNSPVFYRRGGRTSCPHETEEVTKYHEAGSYILSAGTISLDVPSLSISPSRIVGIDATETATFQITLSNESEIERDYHLEIDEESNPFGAIIRLNGLSPTRTITIGAGGSAIFQLTVNRGQIEYVYENLKLRFASVCDDDIFVERDITVEFLPVCSEVSLSAPEQYFVVNTESNNTLPCIIGGYSLQDETLEKIELQYRRVGSADWVIKETFYKNVSSTGGDSLELEDGLPYTNYEWIVTDISDGQYELRAVSYCATGSTFISESIRGSIDRIRPQLFGTPSPGDGILSAGENIQARFNENIAGSLLSNFDISIRGMLNEGPSRVDASLSFDGNDDYVIIPNNSYLYDRSFTIEFWFKKGDDLNRKKVMFDNGITSDEISIYLDRNNHVGVNMSSSSAVSTNTISDNSWHHLAFAFNSETNEGVIYVDSELYAEHIFPSNFLDHGSIFLGRSLDSTYHFNGNLADLRIWGTNKSLASISSDRYVLVNPSNPDLKGHWLVDEGEGIIIKDRVRELNGRVDGAIWQVSTSGHSALLSGQGGIEVDAGSSAISGEQSFMIEFWFNGNEQPNKTLFSNGKADGTDSYASSWLIGTDGQSNIIVRNHGTSYTVENSNTYFDGDWHHLSLVVNPFINGSIFIDSDLIHSFTFDNGTQGLGAAKFWIGARGYYSGLNLSKDQYFEGLIDEFRLWGTRRTQKQIRRDKHYRLIGNEPGLLAYLPFESYRLDAGVPVLNLTWDEIAMNQNVTQGSGVSHSSVVPLIKLPRPVQSLNFSFLTNGDELLINLQESLSRIEHVEMDISVSNVRDIAGNAILNPINWTAFIDQNQLVWSNPSVVQNMRFNGETVETFETSVRNDGGQQLNYSLINVPSYVNVSAPSGVVAPNSEKTLIFTVDRGLNIGDHISSIGLYSPSTGLTDKMLMNIKVREPLPDFSTFAPESFTYSMEIVARVRYNNVFWDDSDVRIMILQGSEIRGWANLEYEENLDQYLAYITVYSNTPRASSSLTFKVWNPMAALFHVANNNTVTFSSGTLLGSPTSPIILDIDGTLGQNVELERGWNWVSFNTISQNNLFTWVSNQLTEDGTIIKSQTGFAVYYARKRRWYGSLVNQGLTTGQSYMIKVNRDRRMTYFGELADPLDHSINLNTGWNWIGMYGNKNLQIGEALSSYGPQKGDIIKYENVFSIYGGDGIGWLGTLDYLAPGRGYLLKTQRTNSVLRFPAASSTGRLENDLSETDVARPNMLMMIDVLNLNGLNGNYQLEAVLNGEVIGSETQIDIDVNNLNKGMFFMGVHGDDNIIGNRISFRLKNMDTNHTIELSTPNSEEVTFGFDKVVGSLDNPLELEMP